MTLDPRPHTSQSDEALESTAGTRYPKPSGVSAPSAPEPEVSGHGVGLRGLRAFYGKNEAVRGITLDFEPNRVTAIIGPSGCGKSTLVRCINRMHEEIPHARAEGEILLDDLDIYGEGVDVVAVRRAIGMVFQKPNPFPTMSVFDNVAAGVRLTGAKGDVRQTVERSLRGASRSAPER